jgi:glucosamine--fructose-6-phosphate aminotransferase (isomerizing)
MTSSADPGRLMRREMQEQPAVLARLVARWDADVDRIASALPDELAGVTFIGRGSSDNAATVGRYAVELFAGVPVTLAAPSLSTRYRAALSYSNHLVIAMSQSGGTPEIIAAGQALRGPGSRLLGITNSPKSELARAADLVLLLSAGEEQAIPATKTVTAQLLSVLAIAAAIAAVRGRPAPVAPGDLDALPAAVEQVLGDSNSIRGLVARWREADRLQVVGRGLDYGAVLEAALKIRETTGVFAQGISAADLVHGPIAALGPGVPVIVADAGGPNVAELATVVERLRLMGADVVTMGTDASATLRLGGRLPETLNPILIVVRGQQLALEWALALGRDPDLPTGLSKMTLTY